MSARGRLPEGWRWVKLGAICREDRRTVLPDSRQAAELPYLGLEHIESQSGRIIRDLGNKAEDVVQSNAFAFTPEHVLYGKLRPYLNKVALPTYPGRCTTELVPILPSPQVDRSFLAWLLRRSETVEAAMRGVTGSRMPRANMKELFAMPVPLPPLPEQRRIVAALEERLATVERARQAARAQLDAARALPAAYLRAVFEGEEARGWPLKPLGDLSEIGTGTTPATNVSAYYQGHIPFIKTAQIVNNRIDRADTHISEPAMQQYGLKLYPIGTILMGMYGQGKTRGQVAILDIPATTTQNAAAIVPRDELISEYLWYWLRRQYLHLRHLGFHGELAHLSLEYVKKLEIPTPGLGVQQRVVQQLTETFSEAGKLIEEIERQLKHIEVLSSSYLQQAFRGEL